MPSPLSFSLIFAAAVIVSVLLRVWLASRQIRHVARHRNDVPAAFAQRVSLAAHQRAADYTIARTRLGLLELALGTVVLFGFTLLGGLQWLHDTLLTLLPQSSWLRPLTFVVAVGLIGGLVDLPLSWYRQFRLEERFGFNRMTVRLWVTDMFKGFAVSLLLGLPLLAGVLALMRSAGSAWWLWAWLLWVGFNLAVLVLYPTVIAPLFNKFEPMPDGPVRERVEALLARCGFTSRGLFVMDGSRRSAHGNAYFTGLGRAKRIVFFDTLLSRLNGEEVEAVLAHELGHFRRRHIAKRMAATFLMSAAGLWLLAWLATRPWFYQGLGITPSADVEAVALVLFFLVIPIFAFPLQPLASLASRRHEFEAHQFAAQHSRAGDLVSALVKMYEDNAATLTPDPLHSAFYDSHPPAAIRVGRLAAA
ncbi:MAG: M48 family metallopeptidase [Burkholderiaceae bacterium]|nr:M48 family metallopeptidase [Burkholderiaceae bacterium]